MYYMWINKNLVYQVGDQTKVAFEMLILCCANLTCKELMIIETA